jgi:hypothetical protein
MREPPEIQDCVRRTASAIGVLRDMKERFDRQLAISPPKWGDVWLAPASEETSLIDAIAALRECGHNIPARLSQRMSRQMHKAFNPRKRSHRREDFEMVHLGVLRDRINQVLAIVAPDSGTTPEPN